MIYSDHVWEAVELTKDLQDELPWQCGYWIRLKRLTRVLMCVLGTRDTIFTHVFNVFVDAGPENTVAGMSFGELDSTVSGVQFVEHGGSDRSWDHYPVLFQEEAIVQSQFVTEGPEGAC